MIVRMGMQPLDKPLRSKLEKKGHPLKVGLKVTTFWYDPSTQ